MFPPDSNADISRRVDCSRGFAIATRLILLGLVAWAGIGLLLWLNGSDAPDSGDLPYEPDSMGAPTDAPDVDSATLPAVAPALEAVPARMSADQFLESLGDIHSDEGKARIRAWLRKDPTRVPELILALRKLVARGPGTLERNASQLYRAWHKFFPDVFGPLQDLEAQLAPALIPLLGAEQPLSAWIKRPSLRALQALAPFSGASRAALETWVRTHAKSNWGPEVAALVIRSATRGEDIEPFLEWLINDEYHRKYLQGRVMPAIARLGPAARCLVPLLAEHVFQVRYVPSGTVKALIAVGPDETQSQRALVVAWLAGGSSPRSVNAAHQYFEGREDAREILLAALEDESCRVRHSAVMALLIKRWGTPDILIPPLLRCLTDSDPVWRDKAMRSIPSLVDDPEQVVPFLEAMFRSHVEFQWVAAAGVLRLLSGLKGSKLDLSKLLSETMRHDNVKVRRVVVEGLRFYPVETGIPLLASALADEDPRVREMATDALGTLAGAHVAAREALEAARQHEDPSVVAMAEAWLEEIRAINADTSPGDTSSEGDD